MKLLRICKLSVILLCSLSHGMSFKVGDNATITDGEYAGKTGTVENSFALAHPGKSLIDCYAQPAVISYLIEVPFEWEDTDIEKARFRIHPLLTSKLHGDPLVNPESVFYVKIGALSVLAHRNWMEKDGANAVAKK